MLARSLALAALLTAPLAAAQAPPLFLYELTSPNEQPDGGGFGRTLVRVGDLDGDGAPDLLVAAQSEDVGPFVDNGRVYVVSGATGAFLRTLEPTGYLDDDALFGYSVADAGDADADGTPDILVGAINHGPDEVEKGRAFVYSGASGARLYTSTTDEGGGSNEYGRAVSGAGDLDGDGHAEFIVAEDFLTSLYDGATGARRDLLDADPDDPFPSFGALSFARMDDLTGDGIRELAVGARRVSVFDLTTGAVLYTIPDPAPQQPPRFADRGALAMIGDVDGDGVGDLAVGSPYSRPLPNQSRRGALYVFSGATGALLLDVPPTTEEGRGLGLNVAAVGDLDGDGAADVLATVPGPSEAPRVVAFSGATGAVLAEVASPFEPTSGITDIEAIRLADSSGQGAIVAVGWSGQLAGETERRRRVRVYGFGGIVAPAPAPAPGPAVSLAVSPNPSAGAASVALTLAEASSVRVSVVDALGRVVAVVHDGPAAGSLRLALPSGVAAGVYAVVAEGAGGRASVRWVVAR